MVPEHPQTDWQVVFPGSTESPGMVVRTRGLKELKSFLEEEIPRPERMLSFSLGLTSGGLSDYLLIYRDCLEVPKCRQAKSENLPGKLKVKGHPALAKQFGQSRQTRQPDPWSFSPGLLPQLAGMRHASRVRLIHAGPVEIWVLDLVGGRIQESRRLLARESPEPGDYLLEVVAPASASSFLPPAWKDVRIRKAISLKPECVRPPNQALLVRAAEWMQAFLSPGKESPGLGPHLDDSGIARGFLPDKGRRTGKSRNSPPRWPGSTGLQGGRLLVVVLVLMLALVNLGLGFAIALEQLPVTEAGNLVRSQEVLRQLETRKKEILKKKKTGGLESPDVIDAQGFVVRLQECLGEGKSNPVKLVHLSMKPGNVELEIESAPGMGFEWAQEFRTGFPDFSLASLRVLESGGDLLVLRKAATP